MRYLAKKAILHTLHHTGWNAAAVARRSACALVLGYHGILSSPRTLPFRYHHTHQELSSHLDWLSARFTPVNLDDFLAWNLGERSFAKPPVLLTFDDGYRNNLSIAAPLLLEKGFPAVFFLATGFIGADHILWPEEVFLRLQHDPGPEIEDPAGNPAYLPPAGPKRQEFAYRLIGLCKRSPEAQRIDFLNRLRQRTSGLNTHVDAEAQAFLSWDEARQLASLGFTLGSHTVTHPILSRIPAPQLALELEQSKATIEAKLGQPCTSIAYPNGGPQDYNPSVLNQAAAAGFTSAFIVSGHWSSAPVPPFAIERVLPPGHASLETFSFVVGTSSGLRP